MLKIEDRDRREREKEREDQYIHTHGKDAEKQGQMRWMRVSFQRKKI